MGRIGAPAARRPYRRRLGGILTARVAGERPASRRRPVKQHRNAALAAMRGLAQVDGHEAAQWSETKVVVTAMEDSEVARLLQVEDGGHVLLRVSIDGAVLSASDIENAASATRRLVELVRSKVDGLAARAERNVDEDDDDR